MPVSYHWQDLVSDVFGNLSMRGHLGIKVIRGRPWWKRLLSFWRKEQK